VHDKEEQARLIRQSTRRAIDLALGGRWREAVEVNKGILETFPNDVDTLNRLGRAYIELCDYAEARAAYARSRELDPYNSIAEKNLKRLAHLVDSEGYKVGDGGGRLEPNYFIEETGKAGVVRLQKPGAREVLSRMVAGDKVELAVSDGSLTVRNGDGAVLGVVDPHHGQRLIRLMAGGNHYAASVTSSSEDSISVIIREVYQDPSQAGLLSFPSRRLDNQRPGAERLTHRQGDYEEGISEETGYGALSEEEEAEPESVDESEEEPEDSV